MIGLVRDPMGWLLGLLYMLPGLILGLTVHEYCHAAMAVALGDPTPKMEGRLTLNPTAHIDGLGLLLFALFNWCFFTRYYRNVRRVAVSFVIASALTFAAIVAGEALQHAVPFVRDRLDTLDAAYRGERLAVLVGCAIVYAAATLAAGKKSIRLFEKQDL